MESIHSSVTFRIRIAHHLKLRLGARVLSLFLALAPAYAVVPVLKELAPPGAQRGKTFTLSLKGENLATGAELLTTVPGAISRLAPSKDVETPDTVLSFLVDLPQDAPVGLYPVRVRTESGVSNLLIFSVGDLPEISEKEPNNSITDAQPISVPVAISGHLTAADQDFYRLTAKAHQRLVMEVEARRIGSAIDPVIEVLDSTGRRIAFDDDAPGLGVDSRVDVTFPKAGTYYVAVHDSKYSEQETTVYRLKVGSYAYAEGIFPLGWQRGKQVEVTFFGGNLPEPVKVPVNLDVSSSRDTVPVNLSGFRPLGSLPFQFQVSDLPEVIAPEDGAVIELKPSTVVNGRIIKPGQVDRFKLKVAPGQQWLFDLQAASLGTSELYGSLTVYDSQGKKLPAKDVAEGSDPKLVFTVPDKVDEVTLAVEDVRGAGGLSDAYRLVARPEAGDFALKLMTPYVNVPPGGAAAIAVEVRRYGYTGPIRLSIPNLPDDLTPEGGDIPIETTNYAGVLARKTLGYLTLTAKPGAQPHALELSVWGEGGSAQHPIRRRAKGPGLTFLVNGEEMFDAQNNPLPPVPVMYPWLGIDLPVGIRKPLPAQLEVAIRNVRMVQGTEQPIAWKLIKQDPSVVLGRVSGSVGYGDIKDFFFIEKDEKKGDAKSKDAGSMMLTSSFDTPLVKLTTILSATVQINGKEETLTAPAITVELVRAYSVKLKSEHVQLTSGGKAELSGTIDREPTFAGTVKVSVGDPPDKVSCSGVELPSGQSEFHVACAAEPGAAPGDFEVHLVSSATIPQRKDNKEFTVPPVSCHLVVAGEKSNQAAANRSGH